MKMKDAFQNLLVENHIPENLKLQYNPILIEKFELINEIIVKSAPKTTNIYFNIAYAYTGRKNKDSLSLGAKNKMESIVSIIVAKTYVKKENISVEIYDSTKLIDIANKSIQKDYIIKYQTIFKMNYCSNSENGFVMNMSLKDYYNLITQDNEILDELFEGNIRDFEGQTVEVNKNIKDTLEKVFNADFWWLNNGVTMIVDSYSPLPNDSAKVVNPIIVNGLQTSYTIFNYFKENLDKLEQENRNILLKIINTNDINVADMIISSTNRQNPVKPAQLKATDPIQKDIEQILFNNGIYYERRKNYYRNRGIDKHKIVTLENLAQYLESIYYGNCSGARNNPTSLLKSDKLYKKLFNEEIKPNIYTITSKIALETLDYLRKIKKNDADIFNKKYSVSLDIFKFYLMRMVALVLCDNNLDNYLTIDLELINYDLVVNIVNYLESIVSKILEENDNIINVSKSKELDNSIQKIDISKINGVLV